jgi:predicted ribosomally synthesized peptide with SipW-like signal peptide
MKKILLSVGMLVFVGAVVLGATGAFFSDTETSTGNTFTAGAIDLKVDNECHYNNGSCPEAANVKTNWEQTDLGVEHKFFWFEDVKPGDFGEDTISLHVDNDAWLRLVIKDVTNLDNSCTEPEHTEEDGCGTNGELGENLLFSVWLDQGEIPGFQGRENDDGDTGEGDNIRNFEEPTLISSGTIDANGEVWNLKDTGLYLKGGETAYFGIDWNLPSTVGNEVQTDSMNATMVFQVEQYRNNPTPFE